MSPSWIWSDKITKECVVRKVVIITSYPTRANGIIVLVNSQTGFCRWFLFPQFYKASGKSILAHYFPYDVKLRLLAHSLSFLINFFNFLNYFAGSLKRKRKWFRIDVLAGIYQKYQQSIAFFWWFAKRSSELICLHFNYSIVWLFFFF